MHLSKLFYYYAACFTYRAHSILCLFITPHKIHKIKFTFHHVLKRHHHQIFGCPHKRAAAKQISNISISASLLKDIKKIAHTKTYNVL